MIKHVVMWRLKDAGDPVRQREQALSVKKALEGLAGRIPELLAIEVGIDVSRDPNSADLVLYSEFKDRAGLETYMAHPAHQVVAKNVREIAVERRMVDYEA
jgi:hypothetical protein